MVTWKDIPGYHGAYQASDDGRIRSISRLVAVKGGFRESKGVILKPTIKKGYQVVTLCQGKYGRKSKLVHGLIALTFLGEMPKGYNCCHNDGDRQNNTVANLRYDTVQSNHDDKKKHGTVARGSKINTSKLTEGEVVEIRERFAAGETQLSLAAAFGISSPGCSKLITGENWAHAPGPTRPAKKRKSPNED